MPSRYEGVSEAIYAQIQRRLVESGEWDRIEAMLKSKLNESGWLDDLHHRSKEMLRDRAPISVENVVEVLGRQDDAVSQKVRGATEDDIRRYLDTQLSDK